MSKLVERAPTWLIAIIVPVIALVAIGITGPRWSPTAAAKAPATGSGSSVAAATVHVTIQNFAFSPALVKVKPGGKIIVTNKDGFDHTFSAIDKKFSTGNLGSNKTATVVAPMTPGKYAFQCNIHNSMTGVLEVEQ
jgi:plastocyanin